MTEVKLEGYSSVEKWLSGINESTRKGYLWHLESFMDWVRVNSPKFGSMTPDELVEFCLDATPRRINEFLDTKKAYLLSLRGRLSHKANGDKVVKSFFAHNRVELPSDRTLNLHGDRPKVEGTLTPEDIKRVILSSNVTYQAVFMVMLGSGMGQSEFVSWSNGGYEDLQRRLDENVKLVKISLHGRKGDKNQYNYSTFIGGDALAALKRYLGERGTRPGAIFINTHGEPLTKVALYRYWTRKLIRIGIKTEKGWTGTNTHEIRDVYRTLWRRSGVPVEYGEYFMGHREAFDKFGYDKTARDEDGLRKQYEAALSILNILSETRPFKLVHEDEVVKLRRELEESKKGQNAEVEELRRELAVWKEAQEERFDRAEWSRLVGTNVFSRGRDEEFQRWRRSRQP
jgi:integrase